MGGWEYRTLRSNTAGGHLDFERLDEELNDLGKDGWELVSVTCIVCNGETMFLVHHFRRPGEPRRRAGFTV
ncbi:MAG: DUF4177 domain-containing protein [Candidatus Hydrogenedentes bacterium]|nr:DUF4177 domain-containing protein [Candidatus Hydrogenedentota bacterium]